MGLSSNTQDFSISIGWSGLRGYPFLTQSRNNAEEYSRYEYLNRVVQNSR